MPKHPTLVRQPFGQKPHRTKFCAITHNSCIYSMLGKGGDGKRSRKIEPSIETQKVKLPIPAYKARPPTSRLHEREASVLVVLVHVGRVRPVDNCRRRLLKRIEPVREPAQPLHLRACMPQPRWYSQNTWVRHKFVGLRQDESEKNKLRTRRERTQKVNNTVGVWVEDEMRVRH